MLFFDPNMRVAICIIDVPSPIMHMLAQYKVYRGGTEGRDACRSDHILSDSVGLNMDRLGICSSRFRSPIRAIDVISSAGGCHPAVTEGRAGHDSRPTQEERACACAGSGQADRMDDLTPPGAPARRLTHCPR